MTTMRTLPLLILALGCSDVQELKHRHICDPRPRSGDVISEQKLVHCQCPPDTTPVLFRKGVWSEFNLYRCQPSSDSTSRNTDER